MVELLRLIPGSREDCFLNGSSAKVSAAAVCHEIRGPKLAPGERLGVSFSVVGKAEGEVSGAVGELCKLKVQLESVVLLQAWAAPESQGGGARASERRLCGEVRIPLRSLYSRYDGALYHIWLLLDSPGPSDSAPFVGLLATGGNNGTDEGKAFSQALANAPKQLFQPRACISLCKLDDLGPSEQALWTADAAKKEKIAHWGPLLRSQQQHVHTCTAQHLHIVQVQKEKAERAAQAADELTSVSERSGDQARELEMLKQRLREVQDETHQLREQRESAQQRRQEVERTRQEEAERQQRTREAEQSSEAARRADQLRQEAESLREELGKISEEANGKIEAANNRIRSLRWERDEALREVEQLSGQKSGLITQNDEQVREKARLSEQKEQLMKIVEDLHHHTTQQAGSPSMTPGQQRPVGTDAGTFRFP